MKNRVTLITPPPGRIEETVPLKPFVLEGPIMRTDDGTTVVLVDGTKVRNEIDVDFCMSSHGLKAKYIPEHEIWIDRAVPRSEWTCLITHEKSERTLMARGVAYADAHDMANVLERRCRARRK